MAEPTEFPGMTGSLKPPPGDEERVGPLPVRRLEGRVVSCWRLSPEELAEVQRTGVVWLSIFGHTHAPVAITGHRAEVV